MDSLLSFPVGLFHPLQHAGLSRRSTYYRETGLLIFEVRTKNPLLRLTDFSGLEIDERLLHSI
jgi:hypothetical protein